MYDLIQSMLTVFINVTAIAGFGGIIAHAFGKQHTNWMAEYCPALNREQPEPDDIWSMPISTSSPRYWGRSTQPQQPILYLLPPAREEVKPANKKSRKTTAKTKTSATPRKKKVV